MFVVVAGRRTKIDRVQRAANRSVADRRILGRGDGRLRLFNRIDHRHDDSPRSRVEHALDVVVIAARHAGQRHTTRVGNTSKEHRRVAPVDGRMFQVDRKPRKADARHQPRRQHIAE